MNPLGRSLIVGVASGAMAMAARPTTFDGKTVAPAPVFSDRWETKLRPGFPPSKPIARLKELHLATPLVEEGRATCAILVPAGRYAQAAQQIRAAIGKRTGTLPPLVSLASCRDPETLLADRHVITFGNMATNPLLFRLYCRWQTLLDLRWPGKGGYALLSLHNPFGTGHNAILVGGSDDEGVAKATAGLATRIETGQPLGWLHDVRLGDGLVPPDLARGDPIRWWAGAPGQEASIAAMKRSACFGWNSIATCACLYYMTGDESYARQFKRLALSRPGHVPDEIRQDYSYWNPANPLVETYHYYSYLVPCLWDLIEEAPVFSDEERAYVTNKLVEQQDHFDPHDAFATPNGSRHCSYQMLNIYTGSRYLATYYPERRWFQRLANVREAFDAWRGNCTWGELDLVPWLPTSEEFLFTFFLLDDAWEPFVADGTAAQLIGPQLHCWTGKDDDPVNRQQALSMMHQAAWLTRDSGWVWLARQADYHQQGFLVGQSWWPSPELSPAPPAQVRNHVSVVPLQRSYWQKAGRSVPLEQGAQFAVYRSSLGPTGDYLRLDMAWFCDRNPYHLATPDALRIAGVPILSGFGANATIRRDGLVETGRVPQIAALTARPALAEGAVLVAEVPNASYGAWTRVLLHRSGLHTVVVDSFSPRRAGTFELEIAWPLAGGLPRQRTLGDGVAVHAGQTETITVGSDQVEPSPGMIHAVTTHTAQPGERFSQASLLRPLSPKSNFQVRSVARQLHIVGDQLCVLSGNAAADGLSFSGTAAMLDREVICFADTTELAIGHSAIRCSQPLSLVWALDRRAASVSVRQAATLEVEGQTVQLRAGTQECELAAPPAFVDQLQAFIRSHSPIPAAPPQARSRTVRLHETQWQNTDAGPALHFATPQACADTGCVPDTTRPFSLEAWVSAEPTDKPQAIVAQWQIAGDQRSFMLLVRAGIPAFWASPDGKWGNVAICTADIGPLPPGWHHLGASWDGTSVTLFVDGKPVGSAPLPTIHASQSPVLLGRYDNGYPFRGRLRGVRLHARALSPAEFAAYRNPPADSPPTLFSLSPPPAPPAGNGPEADWRPAWRCQLPGTAQRLAILPDTGEAWVACEGNRLAIVDGNGKMRRVVDLPAPVTAVAMAPSHPAIDRLAGVVGLDDDRVIAMDRKGGLLWEQKAEVHPKYWLDGHWRAPWFTDPATCHGVLDLAFMDWQDGTPPEIVLGRACTVEFRRLDGALIERLPLDWGDRATLGVGRSTTGAPLVTAANLRRSLGANTQAFDRSHRNVGSRYLGLPAGYTRIPGHGQGFRFPLLADLDGDGQEEYLCALAGSWNDLACYSARTSEPRWARALGSGPRDGTFLAGVHIAGPDAQGRRQIVAAARNGWLWWFDAQGALVQALRLPSRCADLVATPTGTVVGLADGSVRRLSPTGECTDLASLGEPIGHLAVHGGTLLASTTAGSLARLPLNQPPRRHDP